MAAANRFFVLVDANRLAPSTAGSFGLFSCESELVTGIASVSSASKLAFRTLLLLNGLTGGRVLLVFSAFASSLLVVLEIFSESSSLFESVADAVTMPTSGCSAASDDVAT